MTRVEGNGRLVTRRLPLTSSATITVLGVAIAAQALMNAGILTIRLASTEVADPEYRGVARDSPPAMLMLQTRPRTETPPACR
jgi:hypothetical protein